MEASSEDDHVFVPLCRIDEIDEHGSRGFKPDASGAPAIFAVRRGDETYAYRDVCPHYGRTGLAWRRDAYLTADRTHITCAAHGALFQIADGLCIQGPCVGQRLAAVGCRVEGGILYVDRAVLAAADDVRRG